MRPNKCYGCTEIASMKMPMLRCHGLQFGLAVNGRGGRFYLKHVDCVFPTRE